MSILFAGVGITMLFITVVVKGMKNICFQQRKQILCVLCGLVLSLFVGLRSPLIGTDMPGYIEGFHIASNAIWKEILYLSIFNFEKGFIVFNKLLGMISINSQFLCIGCALVAIMPFSYLIYKKSEYPLLSFIILFGLPSFVWNYSALRQMCAIGFLAIAIYEVQEKKLKKFIGVIGELVSLFCYCIFDSLSGLLD